MKCRVLLPAHAKSRPRQGFIFLPLLLSIIVLEREINREPGRPKYFHNNTKIICLVYCVSICTNGEKAMMGKTAEYFSPLSCTCRKEKNIVFTYGCYSNTSWSIQF